MPLLVQKGNILVEASMLNFEQDTQSLQATGLVKAHRPQLDMAVRKAGRWPERLHCNATLFASRESTS